MRKSFKLECTLTVFLFSLGILNSYGQNEAFDKSVIVSQYGRIIKSTITIDSVVLIRDSFSIEFRSRKYDENANKFHAVQIAAVTEDSCLKYIKKGQIIDEIPFFAGGTGLAAADGGYDNLFIDNEAHHYIFYSDANDRRATLLYQTGELLTLKWNIPEAFINGEDVLFKDLRLDKIYLLLINDENLNNVIDYGEYVILTVGFK